jgi:hypothetical protein
MEVLNMNFTEAFERSMLGANKDLLIDNEFENIISTIREAHEDIDFNMSILDEMTKI